MPIQVKAPDGSIAQFPDGMPDADIEAVMQREYPQPTTMQRIAASPVGRFAHDAIVSPIEGALDLGLKGASGYIGGLPAQMLEAGISKYQEPAYQAALAANRNTPGYANARAQADKVQASRGSGFGDQMIGPLVPTIAGLTGGMLGGSLDQANASADAASAGMDQYRSQHPVLSGMAGMVGGLLAAPEVGPLPKPIAAAPKQIAPSITDLKSAARKAYADADKAGVVISAPSYDRLANDITASLANEGMDQTLHPNATAVYKRVQDAMGKPMTFKGMEGMRRVAGNAITASATNPSDARIAGIIQDAIDSHVEGLGANDILPGSGNVSDAVNSLQAARDYWSRASQADLIQKQIDKAGIRASANYSQSGVENSLRQQFKSLALNDRAMKRLSPAVQQSVKDVASGSPMGNLLRFVGKYAPHGPVATMTGMGVGSILGGVSGAAEGGLASVAVPVLGEMARHGATKMTVDAAQRALDTAALGNTLYPRIPQPALKLPALTDQSRAPYGLFGSMALQQQRQ